jgi:hypothetical protein
MEFGKNCDSYPSNSVLRAQQKAPRQRVAVEGHDVLIRVVEDDVFRGCNENYSKAPSPRPSPGGRGSFSERGGCTVADGCNGREPNDRDQRHHHGEVDRRYSVVSDE